MKRIIQAAVLVGLVSTSMAADTTFVFQAPGALERALLDADWGAVRREAPSLRQEHQLGAVADWLSGYAALASADYCAATARFSRLDRPEANHQILDWIAPLVDRHAGSAVVTMLDGDALARSGRYDDALVALSMAKALDPRSALIHDVDGAVAALAGDPVRAQADFRQATVLDPAFADGFYGLGVARMRAHDWSAAFPWLTRATELAPDFALAYSARGVASFRTGDTQRGKEDLNRAARACQGLDVPVTSHNLEVAEWYEAQGAVQRQLGSGEARLAGVIQQQIIVIDIPGIETQGENRPSQWGPVLMGTTDFARHNIRHEGVLGTTLQRAEPGTTTALPSKWSEPRAEQLLAPALADIRAGANTYIKIDQNIKVPGYLVGGKPAEGEWAQSVGNRLAGEARLANPGALIILNTHSKGTLDAHAMDLSQFNQVILASDRGSVSDVQNLANRYSSTQFTVIAGDRDIPHGLQGFMKLSGPNVTVINLKTGGLLPTTVHGQVTDPTYRGTFEVKSPSGVTRLEGTLGTLVQQSRQVAPPAASGLVRGGGLPSLPSGPGIGSMPGIRTDAPVLPPTSYRLSAQQSAAAGANGLKGVGMPVTEMVVARPGEKAEVGGVLGGVGAPSSEGRTETGFICPFLIFTAMPARVQ